MYILFLSSKFVASGVTKSTHIREPVVKCSVFTILQKVHHDLRLAHPLQDTESSEIRQIGCLSPMEHHVAITALDCHSVAKLVKNGVHLLVNLILGLSLSVLSSNLFEKHDQFVQVQFGVCVALNRHFRLPEVLRHHMELSQGLPSLHDIVDGWL